MVEAIGELIASIGHSVVNDSEYIDEKTETKSGLVRALYYLVPISILVGFYIWVVYY